MAGDSTLFAREDYVEEAWRIVDPVLKAKTPVYEYEPGKWGPTEVDQRVVPIGGWHIPVVTSQASVSGDCRRRAKCLAGIHSLESVLTAGWTPHH
jgi:hypothetical protein